jgi:aminoglycoside phosphotransferase (APT) family kinase protein
MALLCAHSRELSLVLQSACHVEGDAVSSGKMHENEVHTDVTLVHRLLAAQFPQWADLPIVPVPSAGTDNALYRLGDELAVRLPRIDWAIGAIEKECRWLPYLAPHLPLPVPVPLAMGEPGEGYPWHWSVCRWLDGENATLDRIVDPCQFADDLARFIVALQRIDPADGPRSGSPGVSRGVPLAPRDASTRAAIAELEGMIDTDAATAAWEAALAAPVWDGPPTWLHGDLQSGNLLVVDGRLSAVIDFGTMGVGDPACDMLVAWTLFTADARAAYRAAVQVDDATWARGSGWALSFGVGALSYYKDTNPTLAGIARHAIAEVLGDTR